MNGNEFIINTNLRNKEQTIFKFYLLNGVKDMLQPPVTFTRDDINVVCSLYRGGNTAE